MSKNSIFRTKNAKITPCVPLFRQMTFGSLSTSFIKEEMAAADPMDVTQIIEEAKVKVQSGPRVRYVVKANPRPAKTIQPPVEEVGHKCCGWISPNLGQRHHIFDFKPKRLKSEREPTKYKNIWLLGNGPLFWKQTTKRNLLLGKPVELVQFDRLTKFKLD